MIDWMQAFYVDRNQSWNSLRVLLLVIPPPQTCRYGGKCNYNSKALREREQNRYCNLGIVSIDKQGQTNSYAFMSAYSWYWLRAFRTPTENFYIFYVRYINLKFYAFTQILIPNSIWFAVYLLQFSAVVLSFVPDIQTLQQMFGCIDVTLSRSRQR